MATTPSKKARASVVDTLQKLSDGIAQHESTVPVIVIAGTPLKPADLQARLQARIAQAKAVATTRAAWQNAVLADKTATEQMKPTLEGAQHVLLAAYAGQLDVLADFGLAPRKKAVVSPATKTAAALKAKATRAARGTKGSRQAAAITTQVIIAPATATAVKVDGPGAVAPAAPAAPASPSAMVAHA